MERRASSELWRRIEQGVHSRQLEQVLFEDAPLDANAGNVLCQPAVLYRVICFAGGVDTLGIAAMVCRRMRSLLENAQLWKFCVRFGKVPARLRPRWWAYCLRIPEVISPTTYQQLVAKGSSGKFMRPVERDIRRSFTDSMKKPLYISSQLRQAYEGDITEAAASYGSAGSLGSTGLAGAAATAASAPLRITTGAADDEGRGDSGGSYRDAKDQTGELWPPVSKSPHVALLERIIETEGVHAIPEQKRQDPDLHSGQLQKFEAIRADMQQALARILVATAEAQPHIGYCQGMNFVAVQVLYTLAETRALSSDYPDEGERDDFLLQFSADEMPERQSLHLMPHLTMQGEEYSFWIFLSMLTNLNMKSLYDPSMSYLPVYCYQFDRLLSAFLPDCHKHMTKRGVTSEMYLVSWFQTLFVYSDTLPVETIHRVWDIFMYEKSWKILFRTALALVRIHQRDILMANMEEIIQILIKLPRYNLLGPDELMNCAMSFKVTNSVLSAIHQQYVENQLQQHQQQQQQSSQQPSQSPRSNTSSPSARSVGRLRTQHLYKDRPREDSVLDRIMGRVARFFDK